MFMNVTMSKYFKNDNNAISLLEKFFQRIDLLAEFILLNHGSYLSYKDIIPALFLDDWLIDNHILIPKKGL